MSRDLKGATSILLTAGKQHDKVVAMLLENEADSNTPNIPDGMTPLSAIILERIAAMLLQKRAKANVQYHQDFAPLVYAAENVYSTVMVLLFNTRTKPIRIHLGIIITIRR
jgi:ankyrin repeat protein